MNNLGEIFSLRTRDEDSLKARGPLIKTAEISSLQGWLGSKLFLDSKRFKTRQNNIQILTQISFDTSFHLSVNTLNK